MIVYYRADELIYTLCPLGSKLDFCDVALQLAQGKRRFGIGLEMKNAAGSTINKEW